MPLSETVRFAVDKYVGEYCARKTPPHARHQVRVEYEVRGSSVTIFESRAPWREDYGPEWTKLKVAQMRYDLDSKTWSMWWANRNGRWLSYPDFTPSPDLRGCLHQLDHDKSGAFWG